MANAPIPDHVAGPERKAKLGGRRREPEVSSLPVGARSSSRRSAPDPGFRRSGSRHQETVAFPSDEGAPPGHVPRRSDPAHRPDSPSDAGAPQGDGWAPACLGFLLVDSAGAVLSANAEALRIVRYPGARQDQAELKQIVKKIIDALLVAAPSVSRPAEWFTHLKSGTRRYRCRAIPLALQEEGHMAILIERAASKPPALAGLCDKHHLTSRERETVRMLARGLTNKQIAARMGVSVNTVKAFIRLVMLKLGVTTRAGILGRLVEE